MTWNDPSAIDGLTLSALEWRRLQSGILSHDTDPISARPGVLAGLVCSVATLTVTVGPGSAVVTPSVGSNGSYIAVNDAAVTLDATAQDATYARIDRVVLHAYDTAVDGSGLAKLVAEIITGTPAAAPAAPALPAGRLEIAQLQVPKAGAGAITAVDKRTWTGTMGTPIVCNSTADFPSGAHLRPGVIAVIGSGATYVKYEYNGTAWLPTLDDTGWITPALASGWTLNSVAPQYRRKNGIVYFQGRAASTGLSSVAFTLPAGFRPGVALVFLAENAGAAMRSTVTTAGAFGQVVAAVASSLSFNSCAPFPADL